MSSERVQGRLRDIVENAAWIEEDMAGLNLERFLTDRTRSDAVERCLQRITEAIIQLGEAQLAEVGLDLPWADIRSLGNRLRHEYRRIDRRVIFDIARKDVPALCDAARRALDS